jgi:hypothetical protein
MTKKTDQSRSRNPQKANQLHKLAERRGDQSLLHASSPLIGKNVHYTPYCQRQDRASGSAMAFPQRSGDFAWRAFVTGTASVTS